MGISRSSFYALPADKPDDGKIVGEMQAIADEFEAYGYRRMTAELRHRGLVVNAKKVRRLMRENNLNPRHRRRYVATTDSDHDHPIFPNRAKKLVPDGPNQLWVADITYVAIAVGLSASSMSRSSSMPGRARSWATRSADQSTPGWRSQPSKPPSLAVDHRADAFTIPIADRNTLPSPTGRSWRAMAWSVRWGAEAIPTTMPKPRAS
jgi:hypothetical protein